MSTTLSQHELAEDLPPYPVRRWTLDEYHALIDQGMFDDERVELLEGWIVPKMTRNPPHDYTRTILDDLLRSELPSGFHLRVQCAVTALESEAEPDLAVVRGKALDYCERHPGRGDMEFIVEISDKTLRKDRRKAAIYAELGVPTYWVVNLGQRQVEVFQTPDQTLGEFKSNTIYRSGETTELTLGGASIPVQVDSFLRRLS